MESFPADLDIHAEVRAHVEGRVNVDEFEPPASSIWRRSAPDLSEERMSLLSPQMSLLVQPLAWCPPVSRPSSSSSRFSLRGSSMCSRVWNGRMAVQTSRVLPFQTSSTSRLSAKSRKRYFLRQRLALLDQLNQVALSRIGEFVGRCPTAGRGRRSAFRRRRRGFSSFYPFSSAFIRGSASFCQTCLPDVALSLSSA